MSEFFASTGPELLKLARQLKAMRFVNDTPLCLRCDDLIAWVVADPMTLEIKYVPENHPGARPLNLCERHREIESGRSAIRELRPREVAGALPVVELKRIK